MLIIFWSIKQYFSILQGGGKKQNCLTVYCKENKMYDLIIAGGGAAGIVATLYALRRRLNVLLVSEDIGGKTNYQLHKPGEKRPLLAHGTDLVEKFKDELEALEFEHRLDTVIEVIPKYGGFLVKTPKIELSAKSVILATGSKIRQLNVPGEQQYIGHGVAYSAIGYASHFVGEHAVVVGSGRSALRAVAELARYAASVHLVAPTHGKLDSTMGKKIASDAMKVTILEGYQVKSLEGGDFIEQVVLESPTGEEKRVSTHGVFVKLGLIPNSDPVKEIAELDDRGYVVVDIRNRTRQPGLFAAGDVTNADVERILVEIGEGIKAASNAYEYLLSTTLNSG